MRNTVFTELIKPVLAIIVVVSAMAYFFVCQFSHQKPNDQIIIAIVGFVGVVLGYYFGNTSGNAKKDEMLHTAIEDNKKS